MSSETVEKVVATAISLVVGLSDNMQITFQSGFEGDEPDAAVNARLDRLVAFANRQKAIAEIPSIEADLFKQREALSQYSEDLARLNLQHAKQQAQRRVELEERHKLRPAERKKYEAEINAAILKMQEHRTSMVNAGQEEHFRSGRAGAYHPAGQVKANLARIDQEIEKAKENREKALADFDETYDEGTVTLQAQIDKAEAERDEAERNYVISIKRYEDAIAVSEEKLAAAREKAGG